MVWPPEKAYLLIFFFLLAISACDNRAWEDKHVVHGVIHEDGGGVDGGRHLAAGTLEGGEEHGVDECRLGVLQAGSNIAGETEVRILVDGAGDQARNFPVVGRVVSKDVRERVGEGGGSLNRRKVHLANVVAVVKAEGGFTLVDGDVAGNADDVLVEFSSNVLEIAEDEGLLDVEADRDDVLGVVLAEADNILDCELILEEELFVVRQHDDKRDVKDILQPPAPVSHSPQFSSRRLTL